MARTIRTCSLIALAFAAATPARADTGDGLAAYVRARAASAAGRPDAAAASYATALAASPGDPVIAARAYRDALAGGDLRLALDATFVLAKAGVAPADASVLLFAAAVKAREWDSATAAANALERGPLGFMAPVLKAWLAQERGDRDAAAGLEAVGGSTIGRRYAAEHRALLLIAAGRRDDGLAALRALPMLAAGGDELKREAAGLLACGDRKAASALVPDGTRHRCIRPGAAWGAARLYTTVARQLGGAEARNLTIVLARSALLLDPAADRARIALAEALAADGAVKPALAALDEVDPRSTVAAEAARARIAVLIQSGDTRAALSLAEGRSDARQLGDLLAGEQRFPEAAAAYGRAIADAGENAGWALYMQHGGALEQAGRWAEARPLLERAVALAPEEPIALNYLGYAQIERGENLAGARAMLERAAALRPDDAAIIDSLGWAWARTGRPAEALPLLESAARDKPADPDIADHLGDVYWALGRRYEARYAWRAAAALASGPQARRITDKLTAGPKTALTAIQ